MRKTIGRGDTHGHRFVLQAGRALADDFDMTEPAIQSDPRLAWDVIETICTARFTGQVSIATAVGTTNVYMTRGLIYFAEHSDAIPIGDRASAAGAIPAELLPDESSILSALADLDALFAGQPASARESIEEVIQLETERTLMEICDQPVISLDSTMYRHHPSGIDRWFSSQHARGGTAPPACEAKIVIGAGETIALIPPPEVIPPMVRETISGDVGEAVRRAVTAIETATKKISAAPHGYVRQPRGPATSR
ncbi:MAG: hypothetical protein ABIZ70_07625 [Gemmatimonadales bacterium]